jgi:predicted TIM-barrel fold metal-dependent hydrolase
MGEIEPLLAGFGGAIDVHAHYLPSAYREALEHGGHRYLDGNAVGPPAWSPSQHLQVMDEIGIATSLLSISSPGLLLSDDDGDAIDLARRVNDQGAQVVRDDPRRFGLFASLPLPAVDASLAELTRAYDDLHADGVSLLTNYAGHYLGDARFDPVLEELARRRAVVAVHPTSPACWEAVSFGRSRGMVEFMFDTARAVFNLLLSGALDRYPGVRFVVPHAGGVIPLLADRADRSRLFGESSQVDVFATLGRQFYDMAGGPLPRQLPALLNLVAPSQLVYGSDYPFSMASFVRCATADLANTQLLSASELRSLFRLTCLDLFPRLRER